MKMLVAVAMIATSVPVAATAAAVAAGNDNNASDRRVCAQAATARSGSRMNPRRVCRTPAQWQAALGPDWRQHLSGRYVEDDMDTLSVRSGPVDGSAVGQQGSSSLGRGPR